MREISPRVDISADDYVKLLPAGLKNIVEEVRRQKREETRSRPSVSLIDRSALMTEAHRKKLLDAVAALVDENFAGRSDMCLQFAELLDRALSHLKFASRRAVGVASYYGTKGEEIFRWQHAWVRVGGEVIDGNVDCLGENPLVPKTVAVAPYWGPITQVPDDRFLREEHGLPLPPDVDVNDIWWPELEKWIDREILG